MSKDGTLDLTDLVIAIDLAVADRALSRTANLRDGKSLSQFSRDLLRYVKTGDANRLAEAWQNLGIALQLDVTALARHHGWDQSLIEIVGPLPEPTATIRKPPEPMF